METETEVENSSSTNAVRDKTDVVQFLTDDKCTMSSFHALLLLIVDTN